MMRVSVLLLRAAVAFALFASVYAQCTVTSTDYYTSTQCPGVVPQITMTNPIPAFTAATDNAVVRVQLPFEVHIYGMACDRVYISSNGNLQWSGSSTTVTTIAWPLSGSYIDQAPIYAPFWADLYMINAGNITYSFETVGSQRIFVVRYVVDYTGYTTVGSELGVSFDVLIWEGVAGKTEVRYYRVDPIAAKVTIGIHDKDYYNLIAPYNNVAINTITLQNTTLAFNFTGPDASTAFCGGLGYNLSSIATRDLTFNDTSSGYVYALRVCGIVSLAPCVWSQVAERSMLCQTSWSSTLGWTNNTYNLGTYNAYDVFYQYTDVPFGLQMFIQDGSYCGSAPRASIINFICDATATSPTFSALKEISTCVYKANVTTNAVCGRGNRDQPVPPPAPPAISTLPTCVRYSGVNYDATMCPRTTASTYYRPEPMTNPMTILPFEDSSVKVNLNFRFFLYEQPYTQLWVSTNGLIEFGYTNSSTAANAAFPDLGLTNDNFPLLLPFWTDLTNVQTLSYAGNYNGSIQLSYEGTAPNRYIIIRFTNVDYNYYRTYFAGEKSVSFDVILSEGEPGGIQYRFYKVDPNPFRTVTIGMHGFSTGVYTSVSNALTLTSSYASQLVGTTVTFTYTGILESQFCGGLYGGYNFTALAGLDLLYNDTAGRWLYYLRPCGSVSAPVCANNYATSHSMLCQVSWAGTTLYSLAVDTPSSTTYTYAPNIVTATVKDGAYCSAVGAARTTVINYVCDQSAVQPLFVSLKELTTCVYTATVNTSLACAAPPNCSVVTGTLYNIQTCSLPNTYLVPPTLSSPTAVFTNTSSQVDDALVYIPIGFAMNIYDTPYDYLWLSSNGNLQFGQSPTTVAVQPMPSASGLDDSLPVVAAFWTDLYAVNTNSNSTVAYSLMGSAPNRYLIVRFDKVSFQAGHSSPLTERLCSFDIYLYEGSAGIIDVVYYRIDAGTTAVGTIGIESNDGSTFTSLYSVTPISAMSLAGKYVRFLYTGQDYASSPSCAGVGYNFTSLMGADLSFSSGTTTYYYRPCGAVSNSLCSSSSTTHRSSICVVNTVSNATSNAAVYNPTATSYTFLSSSSGVRQLMATGPYCTTTTYPSYAAVNFVCDPTTTGKLVGASPSQCFITLTVNSSFACGPGNRNTSTTSSKYPTSTLSSCYWAYGNGYNGQVCPRTPSDPYYSVRQTMTSPLPILVGEDDSVQLIDIGFDIMFYEIPYRNVSIASNGILYFGISSTGSVPSYSFPDPAPSVDYYPMMAPFASDLLNTWFNSNGMYPGSITISREGVSPRRQFIVRYDQLQYYNFYEYDFSVGATFDVVLTEGDPGLIEFRYYRIDPDLQEPFLIGLHGQGGSNIYTSIVNRSPKTPVLVNTLQGSTITFYYNGTFQNESCKAFGFDLTPLSASDLSFVSTDYQYWYHACGIVRNPVCLANPTTSHASLCQLQRNGVGAYDLSNHNPAAMSYTLIGNGLRATFNDGAYCAVVSAPRTTVVNYMCNVTASTAFISSLVESPTCIYTLVVQTTLVCTSLPAVSSSSSSSSTGAARSSSASSTAVSSGVVSVSSSRASSSAAVMMSSSATGSVTSVGVSSSTADSVTVPPSSSSSSSLSDGAIAGVAVGSVVGAFLLCLVVFCCLCTSKSKAKRSGYRSDAEGEEPQETAVEMQGV